MLLEAVREASRVERNNRRAEIRRSFGRGITSFLAEFLLLLQQIATELQLAVFGFVYNPIKSSIISTFLISVIAALLSHFAWKEGSFAPNSDVILTSPGWAAVTMRDCFPAAHYPTVCDQNPASTWSNAFTASAAAPTQGADWDSFNALGYAADLVVPVLDLGQTDAWAPSKDRGFWGWLLWWMRWVLAVAGWVVTGLGVAAVTGVMQRNQPD